MAAVVEVAALAAVEFFLEVEAAALLPESFLEQYRLSRCQPRKDQFH